MYDLSNVKILIVEDNKHMRQLLLAVLRALGIRSTREAENGEEGLDLLADFLPDLVICDWEMPGLDGPGFVKAVRRGKDSANPFVPIIMLTGHADASRVLAARDLGSNEFLVKPMSPQALYSRLMRIIGEPRMFVSNGGYFGPCRRRRQIPWADADRRQSGPDQIADIQQGVDKTSLGSDNDLAFGWELDFDPANQLYDERNG